MAKKASGTAKGAKKAATAGKATSAKKADQKAENPKAVTGDNLLTEDQQRGLFFNHLKMIKKGNAEIAEIEVELRAARKSLADIKKIVKAEGTLLVDIETALRLEDGDEKVIRGEIENQIKIAKWLNAPLGFQLELLDQDRRPSADKAFEEGKIAGLKGLAARPPHDPSVPQYKRWLEGHQEGQAVLSKRFKPLKPADDTPKGSQPKDTAETTRAPTPPAETGGDNVVSLQQGGKA